VAGVSWRMSRVAQAKPKMCHWGRAVCARARSSDRCSPGCREQFPVRPQFAHEPVVEVFSGWRNPCGGRRRGRPVCWDRRQGFPARNRRVLVALLVSCNPLQGVAEFQPIGLKPVARARSSIDVGEAQARPISSDSSSGALTGFHCIEMLG